MSNANAGRGDPQDLHEWISFDDPDHDQTWIFDATFLLSSWTCIWGRGCQGVLTEPAEEYQQGCCSYGAHFVDAADRATVERTAELLDASNWQFAKAAATKGWLTKDRDGTEKTRVHQGACIFLNRPGFAGGAGCALHAAALAAGERPMDWKPDVCWQLPLRRVDHTDENGHVTSTLREWKRRDWGDGGREFAWWCTESADAFIERLPVYVTLRDEITEMVGGAVYALLAGELDRRRRTTRLPHPAVRRRS